ncbi:MAG: Zn-ribbon domain-containing OB-fold protein [Hyphomicrobium sp.]
MPLRPLPEPSTITAPFWEACKAQRLLLQQCRTCGHIQFYPRSLCTACMSDQLEWSAARGTGKVYSHSTVYRALVPGFEDDVPYVVAMIELDEGVRLLSQIIYCEPEEVFIGLRVSVIFEEAREGVVLPKFRPLPAND